MSGSQCVVDQTTDEENFSPLWRIDLEVFCSVHQGPIVNHQAEAAFLFSRNSLIFFPFYYIMSVRVRINTVKRRWKFQMGDIRKYFIGTMKSYI